MYKKGKRKKNSLLHQLSDPHGGNPGTTARYARLMQSTKPKAHNIMCCPGGYSRIGILCYTMSRERKRRNSFTYIGRYLHTSRYLYLAPLTTWLLTLGTSLPYPCTPQAASSKILQDLASSETLLLSCHIAVTISYCPPCTALIQHPHLCDISRWAMHVPPCS